ncbi:PLAC8 motif-containing protein [Trema orientale]|uniref:PLAC8 motif-containing protein n=1 Tax=Trema orientale TaxID=63057 RepID=A0A2P5EPB8_TREOI|nr:PLAC8 motif-containing protein [Trema orientale]
MYSADPKSTYEKDTVPAGIPVASANSYYNQAQPGPHPIRPRAPVPWSTGLCDCFSDVRNSCGASGALYTLIMYVTGFACIYSCLYRSKMRQQYNLKESPCGDCLTHCFCEGCALCQEYRELKSRGFNMKIGWQGNVERNRELAMGPTAPTVEGGMTR